MSAEGPQPERGGYGLPYVYNTNVNGAAVVGDHASARFGRVGRTAAESPLVSIKDEDVTVPVGQSPLLDTLLEMVGTSGFVFIERYGRRVVALVPAEVAESMLGTALDDEAPPEGPAKAAWAALRRVRERGAPRSLLERGIMTGEIQPPTRPGLPDIIPELADLPSLSDALIDARERERGP
jgi:hypothetical protein